jgi:TRAP-type C4-dicarboxylate transport system permease large subunit
MFALSRAMIWANVSQTLVVVFTEAIPNKYIFLLVVNILLIIMGMLMDDVSGCILAGIFLLPIAVHFGVNPLHFGAIVGVNLGLGNLTPPVAPLLYLAAGVGDVPVKFYPPNIYTKTVVYLLLFGQLPVLILVTYLPELSLFLPKLYMG